MSAPHSSGRHRYGVAKVLSTRSGSPCSCAMAAIACDVEHIAAGVADRLAEKRLGVVANRALPCAQVVGIDPGQLHIQLAQHVLELVDRAAVQGRGRHDVVARGEQREQRRGLRGQAAGEGDRAAAALEARDALLEHGHRRVHDPRVGIAVLLEVEVCGRRRRILEHVARGLKNRHRTRAGIGVRTLTGVDLAGLEAETT